MKVIFSRKGFDSSAGGYPSLIFPDGTLYSIPIHGSKNEKISYGDINYEYNGEKIQSILKDLTKGKFNIDKKCHNDPMFYSVDNKKGVALGQADRAEGHLRNQQISEGDIFLFYGWFKEIEKIEEKWRYTNKPDLHIIWSYMEVKEKFFLDKINEESKLLDSYPFLKEHPHIGRNRLKNNSIYISKKSKYFDYNSKRFLTDVKNYSGRSTWRLPNCFNQPQTFTFLKNFNIEDDDVIINYKGYGQEFVLDIDLVDTVLNKKNIQNWLELVLK
jgi:hypothetical protein